MIGCPQILVYKFHTGGTKHKTVNDGNYGSLHDHCCVRRQDLVDLLLQTHTTCMHIVD